MRRTHTAGSPKPSGSKDVCPPRPTAAQQLGTSFVAHTQTLSCTRFPLPVHACNTLQHSHAPPTDSDRHTPEV
eukprot:4380184-Pleurochrysis_carterae.AAC.1